MSFIRREFFTKDKEIQQYLDRLMTHKVVELPPRVAMDLGRTKVIRSIREIDQKKPLILIGHDRKYNISMIKIRDPVKIIKNGNKYIFSL